MDTVCYRKGFEDGLDVALRLLREDPDGGFGEIAMLSTNVRLEKAGEIIEALHGP